MLIKGGSFVLVEKELLLKLPDRQPPIRPKAVDVLQQSRGGPSCGLSQKGQPDSRKRKENSAELGIQEKFSLLSRRLTRFSSSYKRSFGCTCLRCRGKRRKNYKNFLRGRR